MPPEYQGILRSNGQDWTARKPFPADDPEDAANQFIASATDHAKADGHPAPDPENMALGIREVRQPGK